LPLPTESRAFSQSRDISQELAMRGAIRLWLAFAIVLGAMAPLAFQAHWLRSTSGWLAFRLGTELESAPDEQVPQVMAQLAALDERAVPALVELLGNRRMSVRSAAEQALHQALDRWRALPAAKSAAQTLELSQLLAERIREESEGWDADALRRAAPLALRALDWPRTGIRETALTYACERVICAARDAGVFVRHAPPEGPIRGQELEEVGTAHAPAVPRGLSPLGSEPARAGSQHDIPVGDPRWAVPVPAPGGEQDPSQVLLRQDLTGDRGIPPPAPLSEVPISAIRSTFPELEGVNAGGMPGKAPPAISWSAMSDADVVRKLADAGLAAAAELELRRRGFRQRELRIAAATVDPDPHVREQLARTLPELSDIDPRPWLLLLGRDASPQVRAVAVRWLATSDDPRVRDQLSEIADRETDTAVLQALGR
jgi:hypothetical protein